MKIILDYDATLVDLMSPWLKWLRETEGVSLTTKDVRYFGWIKDAFGEQGDDFWRTPGIYDSVDPLPGAESFVNHLLRRGFTVEVVSSSHSTMYAEKELHCARHFGVLMRHSHEKHKLTQGSLLIDDCPAHAHAHVKHNHGCRAFIFNYKGEYGWAKPLLSDRNIRTVTGYDQIINLLKEDRCR